MNIMEIKNGKLYVAPDMYLVNKLTGKPITEKEYFGEVK